MQSRTKLILEMKKKKNQNSWVALINNEIIRKPLNPNLNLSVNFLEVLTPRQRDLFKILIAANYWNYPRSITSKELAEKHNTSQSTLCVTIQKIESKMVQFFITGGLK